MRKWSQVHSLSPSLGYHGEGTNGTDACALWSTMLVEKKLKATKPCFQRKSNGNPKTDQSGVVLFERDFVACRPLSLGCVTQSLSPDGSGGLKPRALPKVT